jgi:beta-galactosidase
MNPSRPDSDFLWGAATAAYQIEGAAAEDGRAPSIWDVFCATPGKTARGETGAIACDHYHRYREDIGLMRRLNLGAYRFSISWPRVIPSGRGTTNEAGWTFYERLVDELCAAGIRPVVTLFHWDLPAALQNELGGWAHDDLPAIFADYAAMAFARLGDRVSMWLTINEPWCVAELGHVRGCHAPGLKDPALGYRVAHNLLRAHAHAVARYRAARRGPGAISFALNTSYSFPASALAADRAAAERAIESFAGWFGDPGVFGAYPAVMRARLGSLLPEFSAEDTRLLKGSMDFIALNYYTSDLVRHVPGAGPFELEASPVPDVPRTATGWPVVPEGLHRLLHWLSGRYARLPIHIMENGAAFDDRPDKDGFVDDQDRIAYLRDHLAAIARARGEGVDVRGYFAWSLLDNLEWAEGFSKRFGLVRCDFETLRRTIKASGYWYAQAIASGGLGGAGAVRTDQQAEALE